jgi:hypothetical protein
MKFLGFDLGKGTPLANILPDHIGDSPLEWHVGDIAVCVDGDDRPWISFKQVSTQRGPNLVTKMLC